MRTVTMTPEQPSSRITVDGPQGTVPPRRSHRWLLPLIGVLVVGAIWSFRGEATPENLPPDLASIETTTTTTRPDLEGDLSVGWAAIDLPGTGEVVELIDTRFGLFAVVHHSAGATLWQSLDGYSWNEVPDGAGVFEESEIKAIVETEYGLVAVGSRTSQGVSGSWGEPPERRIPAVWRSRDGSTWDVVSEEQIERPLEAGANSESIVLGAMNDVAVWKGRLVAVGWSSSGTHRAAAWVSDPDGSSWSLAPEGLDGRGTRFTYARAVAVLNEVLYAVGTTFGKPALWTSPDSMTWEEADPGITLGSVRLDYPFDIVPHGTGLVSAGAHTLITDGLEYPYRENIEGPYSVVWITQDGREWLRLAPEELSEVLINDVVALNPWLIAAGRSTAANAITSAPGVWFSATGSKWEKVDVSVEGYGWGESGVNALVEGGPGLVAGGTLHGLPELWVWSPSGSVDPNRLPEPRPRPGGWALITEVEADLPVWNVRVVFGEYLALSGVNVWRSDDYVTWGREALVEAGLPSGMGYHGPVVIEETVYVVDEVGRVWSSTDGRRWSFGVDLQLEGWPGGLFAGPDGELLVLEHADWEDGIDTVRLWRRSNGDMWVEIPLPELEWIAGVTWLGDRYVLAGSNGYEDKLWVSDDARGWVEVEWPDSVSFNVGFGWTAAGPVKGPGDRLFAAGAGVVSDGEPATHILSSDDGLQWTDTGAEIPGWAGGIVDNGGVMVLRTSSGSWGSETELWSSTDGVGWEQLGPLPTYQDSWIELLPSHDGHVRVMIQAPFLRPSIWEWIPGEES